MPPIPGAVVGAMPPMLKGMVRLLVPLLACFKDCREDRVGLMVVGCAPGAMTGDGGGGGNSCLEGVGAEGILGARHMITDCVLT